MCHIAIWTLCVQAAWCADGCGGPIYACRGSKVQDLLMLALSGAMTCVPYGAPKPRFFGEECIFRWPNEKESQGLVRAEIFAKEMSNLCSAR